MPKKSIAMARGCVVLDQNLNNLKKGLEDRNIRTLISNIELLDFEMKKVFLSNRIVITDNSKNLIDDAPCLDYGIITTEELSSRNNDLVKLISKAITSFSLWTKRHGYILTLKESGKHKYQELTQ